MKQLFFIVQLSLLLALTSCSTIKNIDRKSHVYYDTLHTSVVDTTHVMKVVTIVDTIHTQVETHVVNHIEEVYDPETGRLQKRIVDQEQNMTLLYDQIQHMQSMIDSLKYISSDSTHVINQSESEEHQKNEAQESTFWDKIKSYFAFLGFCVLMSVIIFFVSNKINRKI